MSDDYVRITARVERVTTAAALLSTDDITAWVPRSCLHGADDIFLKDSRIVGEEHEFRMREWVAEQKGFI